MAPFDHEAARHHQGYRPPRRGTDIVKALALGACAVLVGRPVLWGLAVDGERGVSAVLGILSDELDLAMALCGCRSLAEITPDLVRS